MFAQGMQVRILLFCQLCSMKAGSYDSATLIAGFQWIELLGIHGHPGPETTLAHSPISWSCTHQNFTPRVCVLHFRRQNGHAHMVPDPV